MREKVRKKQNKLIERPLLITVVLVLSALIIIVGGVLAKYVRKGKDTKNLVNAGTFYFTSDYLEEWTSSSPKNISVNSGVSSVSFELRNFADALRYADINISYNIECVSDDTTISLSSISGTLTANTKDTDTITLSGLEDGESYTITASGYTVPKNNSNATRGYQKTLKATFTVGASEPKVYKSLTSTTEYVELSVWTEGSATGTASITYPAGLIPDNTDPAMSGWTSSTSAAVTKTDSTSFTVGHSSHRYRFFKQNTSATFDATDFTITVGGTTATVSTP